jgi:glucosyl-3-phosphoglycerate phosphatase
MSRLYLVRHGETGWNAQGRLQGQSDQPLSERGKAQARDAADLLSGLSFDHVVCSDLVRARATADLLGYPDAPADPLWREIGVGQWSGRLVHELRSADIESWRSWRAGEWVPPGGEDWEPFRARLQAGLAGLPQRADTVLIVTHGGVIRTVVSLLLRVATGLLAPVPAGSLTVVDRGDWPRLRRYGQTLRADLTDSSDYWLRPTTLLPKHWR